MRRAAIAGLAVVTIVAAAARGNSPVVLLNDNFNVTQSSADMNWQLPIRQTGALAEIPYIQSVDDTSAYHELTQRNGELQLSSDRITPQATSTIFRSLPCPCLSRGTQIRMEGSTSQTF